MTFNPDSAGFYVGQLVRVQGERNKRYVVYGIDNTRNVVHLTGGHGLRTVYAERVIPAKGARPTTISAPPTPRKRGQR